MRMGRTLGLVEALFTIWLLGCGGTSAGSGGSGGIGAGGSQQTETPVLNFIAPSSVVAGSSAITLTAYGSNFVEGAQIAWNGKTLSTTWVDAGELTAQIVASTLASAGTATVTVINPAPNGGTSGTENFSIAAVPAAQTFVRHVSGVGVPFDIAWDASRGRLYASMSAADPAIPNTLVAIDPVTGTISTPVPAGKNPHYLALAADMSALWVGLDGNFAVQRFMLPGMTPDISFTVPSYEPLNIPQTAVSLQAAPVSPHTVAVLAGGNGLEDDNGAYIYDDGVQRSAFVPGPGPGGGPLIDAIQWGRDDSVIYGVGGFAGILSFPVTSSGVSLASRIFDVAIDVERPIYDRTSGLLYSVNLVDDPNAETQVGSFDVPLPDTACTTDAALGRYYCATVYSNSNFDVYYEELWVFDLHTYALLNRVQFGWVSGSTASQPNSSVTGSPMKLVRWGNAGLALLTSGGAEYNVLAPGTPYGNGGIFLIDGPAVNPNATPDVTTGAAAVSIAWLGSLNPQQAVAGSGDLTVTLSGTNFTPSSLVSSNYNFSTQQTLPTSFVNSTTLQFTIPSTLLGVPGPLRISLLDQSSGQLATDSLTFTVVPASGTTTISAFNLAGSALAWEPNSNKLYVAVANVDGAYPNSILAIDGTNGKIVNAQSVTPDPFVLSLSSGGQFLYAAFDGSSTVTQFQLPGITGPLSWPLHNPAVEGAYLAGDVKAAPVDPHTIAVTLFSWGSTPRAQGGIAIYDDAIQRPDVASGWGIATSAFPPPIYDTLAWSSSDSLLTAAPQENGGGPLYAVQVDPSGASYLSQGTSVINPGYIGGNLHSDFGTGLIYSDEGFVADPFSQAIVGQYNASGIVLPDSSLNRAFILGQTAAQAQTNSYTIESFDEKAYTPVSTITLTNLIGTPFALAPWGASGLAVLTANGGAGGWGGSFGMLYLINDPTFVNQVRPAAVAKALLQDPVKLRWKPITREEIIPRLKKIVTAAQ